MTLWKQALPQKASFIKKIKDINTQATLKRFNVVKPPQNSTSITFQENKQHLFLKCTNYWFSKMFRSVTEPLFIKPAFTSPSGRRTWLGSVPRRQRSAIPGSALRTANATLIAIFSTNISGGRKASGGFKRGNNLSNNEA